MNRRRSIVISTLWVSIACAQALAHGGFTHVTGTIANIDGDTLLVKTAKAQVPVKLTAKTDITKDDEAFPRADLRPGMRVVIDVPEGAVPMTAHSVKVGVATHSHAHPGTPAK